MNAEQEEVQGMTLGTLQSERLGGAVLQNQNTFWGVAIGLISCLSLINTNSVPNICRHHAVWGVNIAFFLHKFTI